MSLKSNLILGYFMKICPPITTTSYHICQRLFLASSLLSHLPVIISFVKQITSKVHLENEFYVQTFFKNKKETMFNSSRNKIF